MIKLLFLGLGRLSAGDVGIAADLARQLERTRFRTGFVTAAEHTVRLRDLGLAALPLDGGSAGANLTAFDGIVRAFRPDYLIAADAFTLDHSAAWSGLSMTALRERYDIPVGSFDRYDWQAGKYMADFYAGNRVRFPSLLDRCDLVIRTCPISRPTGNRPGVAVVPLDGGGPRRRQYIAAPRQAEGQFTLLLANSGWEHVNLIGSEDLGQLVKALPQIIHSHLAALRRPLRLTHVSPRRWRFRIAGHITYQHFSQLPPAMFQEMLLAADVFLTTNAASLTLAQAVLAGVPALLLQNHKVLDVTRLAGQGGVPRWLSDSAPGLRRAWPFRALPWGWHDMLTRVLADNPYNECFRTAHIFERACVLRELGALLDDPAVGGALRERQRCYAESLRSLPAPGDVLESAIRQS